MKFLLLGKGKSIECIKRYIKSKKDSYVQAVFDFEYKRKYLLIDENLLNLEDIDYVIKSPGISETNQMYLKLSLKFKFINELDLLSLYKENIKSIVVTGSNGKTLFVSMLTYLLKKAHKKVISCGNSFKPITYYYKKFNKLDYLIIEQSSYQLHNLSFYKPFISILLNLNENHLDNSFSLLSYYENKKNIYKYQDKNCYFILDESIKQLKNISCNANIIELIKYNNLSKIDEKYQKYSNYFNYFYTIFKLINIDENIIDKINKFKLLKYRLNVIKKRNITYINDSKSTNVNATLFAISNIKNLNNTVLIVGGKDKKINYSLLNNINCKYIISYGEIKNKINNSIKCNTLKEAFIIAKCIDLNDKIILFSPATSSFDQFKSYIDRGKYFNYLIRKYG